jgi:branched-chain amino acid transport system substrate-binding protein
MRCRLTRLLPSAFCLLPSAFCLLAAGCFHKGASQPVMIGHVAPLSGPDKAIGEHAVHGIQLAVEEANTDGGLIDGRRVAVEHADSHGDRSAVAAMAVRLIRLNRVAAVLLGTDADQVADLGSVGREYEIPLLVPEGLPDRPAGDWVFYTGVSPAERGKALARFAAGIPLKAARVFVLIAVGPDRGPVGAAVAAAFITEFRKKGGTILGQATYKDAAGLKEAVKQLGTAPADAVFLAGAATDLAQLRDAKLDARLPVILGAEEASVEGDPAGPPGPTVYAATAFAVDAGTRQSKQFTRKYQDRFGDAPDVHAVVAHDEARLLFEAIRQAKSIEGAKVREALAGLTDFEGLTGPVSFKDHWASRTVFIIRLKKGRMETVAHYRP